MGDTQGVQAWHTRQREEGKTPVTVWLSREEKRRLEALAQPWHCSTSALVQHALSAFHHASPPVTAAVTDMEMHHRHRYRDGHRDAACAGARAGRRDGQRACRQACHRAG